MFSCMVTPPSESYCVSELQFLDGIMDCPDGSDEPVNNAPGNTVMILAGPFAPAL